MYCSTGVALVSLRGVGNGKLLLFGEHVILYGYPAWGIGIPLKVELIARRTKRLGVTINSSLLDNNQKFAQYFRAACASITDKYWKNSYGIALDIKSNLPISAGLGSSAALSVATAHLMHYGTTPVNRLTSHQKERIRNIAHILERAFHDTPSGVDTALATTGTLSVFRPATPPHHDVTPPLSMEPSQFEGAFALIVIPRIESAATLIRTVRTTLQRSKTAHRTLTRLGELTTELVEYIKRPLKKASLSYKRRVSRLRVTRTLAEYANRAHTALRDLGLTHQASDYLLQCARAHGALGGKISGAGGGGAHWVIFEHYAALRKALPALKESLQHLQGSHASHAPHLYSGVISGDRWRRFHREL